MSWEHRAQMATRGHTAQALLDAAVGAGFTVRWVCPRPSNAASRDEDEDHDLLLRRLKRLRSFTYPDFRMVVLELNNNVDTTTTTTTTTATATATATAPPLPVGTWPNTVEEKAQTSGWTPDPWENAASFESTYTTAGSFDDLD